MFHKRLVLLLILFACSTVRADDIFLHFQDKLTIADIARFDDLPTRLYLRSEFAPVPTKRYLPDEFVQLFIRILDGDYERELHIDAARSLERVALEKLADPAPFRKSLTSRLKQTESLLVIRACAMALVAADARDDAELLAELCQPDNEALCSQIEPKLASWNYQALVPTWQSRIRRPDDSTRVLVCLACRCLAEVGHTDSVQDLTVLALNEKARFLVRKAAARAVASLDAVKAGGAAILLVDGDIPQRVLAATLLETASEEKNRLLLAQLCEDSEDAVASLAWASLRQLDPPRLVEKLERGIAHKDANVRKTAIEVMQELPSPQHANWLNQLMSDEHIQVRNNARAALDQVASAESELRPLIVANAGAVLGNSNSSWQQLEQALLLLGQQSHAEFQPLCMPLLKHERHEVMVTAAWLLHMMPEPELGKGAVDHARVQWEYLNSPSVHGDGKIRDGVSEQMIFLFHMVASTKQMNAADLCAEMFSKAAPTSTENRAAGLWALGILKAGTPDDVLMGKFVERIFDDNPVDPEKELVKATSALALGWLGMKEAIPDLRRAHATYGTVGPLGFSVSTAVRMLGEEPEPTAVFGPSAIGDWPILPAPPRN